MRRSIVTLLALAGVAIAMPGAAGAAEVDRYDGWRGPNLCAAFLPQSVVAQPSYRLSVATLTGRLLDLGERLTGPDPWADLTLERACRAMQVPLVETMVPEPVFSASRGPRPPHHAGRQVSEPEARMYNAILHHPSVDPTPFISFYDGPGNRTLTFSLVGNTDPKPFSGNGLGLYADMGSRCELRGKQVADRLNAAGYEMRMVGFEPPDAEQQRLYSDSGPKIIFERGAISVGVLLQGDYAHQRKAKLDACVGNIEMFVRAKLG